MKIDIIIPTYNRLQYLKEAIDSVLTQTYQDWLMYVVDDGSTDNNATEKYVKGLKDPRVKYLRKPNGGPSSARNFGFKKSNSPLVAFLDSDDIWRKHKLERQVALIQKDPGVGLVYGLTETIEPSGRRAENRWTKTGHIFNDLIDGPRIPGSASMILLRREVLNEVGVFREDSSVGEDWELWLRISDRYKFDCVKEVLATIRILGTGSQADHQKMARGLEHILSIMLGEFKLSAWQRSRLRGAVYRETALHYLNAEQHQIARQNFFLALKFAPQSLFVANHRVWFLYLRILLGNSWLRALRRRFSKKYRDREESR